MADTIDTKPKRKAAIVFEAPKDAAETKADEANEAATDRSAANSALGYCTFAAEPCD